MTPKDGRDAGNRPRQLKAAFVALFRGKTEDRTGKKRAGVGTVRGDQNLQTLMGKGPRHGGNLLRPGPGVKRAGRTDELTPPVNLIRRGRIKRKEKKEKNHLRILVTGASDRIRFALK